MRGLRTGLPRWARGTGLHQKRKASAHPSLAKLIREDDAEALRGRLCQQPLYLLEVLPDPDFFTKQWPRLLRQACLHLSHSCLEVLINLLNQGEINPPPLPPRALGWLLEGREQKAKEIDTTHALFKPGIQSFLGRVSQGPISLSKSDGLRILRLGGWEWALGDGPLTLKGTTGEKTLHPGLKVAWRAWCAKQSHIDEAISLIGQSLENPSMAMVIRWALDDFFDHIPPEKEEYVRNGVGDVLMGSGLPRVSTKANAGAMMTWAKRFLEREWPLDHPVWETWGKQTITDLKATSSTIAKAWVDIVLLEKLDTLRALPGWGWDDSMQGAITHCLPNGIPRLLDSDSPEGWMLNGAWDWLETMDRLEEKLAQLGWREPDRLGWLHSIDKVLGKDWEGKVEAGLQNMKNEPNLKLFQASWTSWKERRMELTLPKAAVKFRSTPRF